MPRTPSLALGAQPSLGTLAGLPTNQQLGVMAGTMEGQVGLQDPLSIVTSVCFHWSFAEATPLIKNVGFPSADNEFECACLISWGTDHRTVKVY